ncbi:MAG: hypothetical protein IZT55_02245, partial [Anaerolineae bacterium]|nr:hypothetical protein [Anaerolineae bacterium]
MIIHQPEIIRKDGHAFLWAKLEMDTKHDHFPDYVWYRVPERYASGLCLQSDAFLVVGLLAGMYYGEDIQVRGPVSPRLAYHLDEYQFLLQMRKPMEVQTVNVKYDHLHVINESPLAVGTTFSGGVDSLYTTWSHLPANQPNHDYRVTHGIFIRGFDLLHSENENYQNLFHRFRPVLQNIDIELIELDTNIFSIIHQRLNFSYYYGPLIVSTGLSLSGMFKRFFVPSTWDYTTLSVNAHSSDPLVDGFLSTDKMEIIHHGSTCKRVEKVERISDW